MLQVLKVYMEVQMKAYGIKRFGVPDVLEPMELPKPSPGMGEVLIRVAATSINPVDYKLRRGDIPLLVPSFPAVLHPDAAGVVEVVGESVAEFTVGDGVWAFATGIAGIWGASADYMAADSRMISHKPNRLSLAGLFVLARLSHAFAFSITTGPHPRRATGATLTALLTIVAGACLIWIMF
jgi:NADPH2:quinone reductase